MRLYQKVVKQSRPICWLMSCRNWSATYRRGLGQGSGTRPKYLRKLMERRQGAFAAAIAMAAVRKSDRLTIPGCWTRLLRIHCRRSDSCVNRLAVIERIQAWKAAGRRAVRRCHGIEVRQALRAPSWPASRRTTALNAATRAWLCNGSVRAAVPGRLLSPRSGIKSRLSEISRNEFPV